MVYELYLSKAATKKKKNTTSSAPHAHRWLWHICRRCNITCLGVRAAVHLCSPFLFPQSSIDLPLGFLTFELSRKTGTRKQKVDFPEATQQMTGRSRAWGSIPRCVPPLGTVVYMEVKVWLSSIFRSFFTAIMNSTGKRECLERMRNHFLEANSKYMVSIKD